MVPRVRRSGAHKWKSVNRGIVTSVWGEEGANFSLMGQAVEGSVDDVNRITVQNGFLSKRATEEPRLGYCSAICVSWGREKRRAWTQPLVGSRCGNCMGS
jgi:hypothetical protein